MKKSKYLKIILSWLLVIIWFMVIFGFSNKNATQSTGMSSGVIELVKSFLPFIEDNHMMQVLVRKSAHMIEYAIMFTLILQACFISFDKRKIKLSFFLTLLIALSDEFHQLFIEGRAGQVKDAGIDMIGALIAFLLILWVENKLSKKIRSV